MAVLGPTIVARFLADTRQLTASIAAAEAEGTSKLAALGKAAIGVAIVLGAIAAVNFAADSVSQASDLVESMNKVSQVFKEGKGDIIDWSKDAAKRMGLSQQKALEAVGTFGNLAVSLELPRDKAAEMSKGMVELAADLGSFNNVPTPDALAAIQSGLVGQTRPLRRFGVNMSEATLKAEALRTGLIHAEVDTLKLSTAQEAVEKALRKQGEAMDKHGEDSEEFRDATRDVEQAELKLNDVMEGKVPRTLDAAAKAQAAYSTMVRQTTTAHGDYARTADDLANATKTAGAETDDLKAKIGTVLMPAVKGIVSFYSDTLIPGVENFGRALKNSEAMQALADGINNIAIPALKDLVGFITDKVMPALQSIHDWAADNKEVIAAVFIGLGAVILFEVVPALIAATAAAISFGIALAVDVALFIGTIAVFFAPFLLAAAIIAVIAFIIIKNWDTIKNAAAVAWEAITGFVSSAWDTIKNVTSVVWDAIFGFLSSAWGIIMTAATAVADWIVGAWNTIFGGILAVLNFLSPLWTALIVAWDMIRNAVTSLWGLILLAWEGIKIGIAIVLMALNFWWDALEEAWNAIKAAALVVWDAIVAAWNGILDGIRAVMNFLAPVWNLILIAWDNIKLGASIVANWIGDRWNDLLFAIRVVMDFLAPVWQRILDVWDNIKLGASLVAGWIGDRWNDISNAISNAVGSIKRVIDEVMNTFIALKDTIGSVASGILDSVTSIARSMADMIMNIVKGPINAVISVWNNLSFDLPKFEIQAFDIPGIGRVGGVTLGGQHIDFPDLPLLAGGGVLTNPTLFIGGEAGTEIVAPEDMLRTIIAEESRGNGHYTLNMYPRTADSSSIAYGFRRLELLAGL